MTTYINPKTDKVDKCFYTPELVKELFVRKAYTSAFHRIVELPVFTHFDIWKPFTVDVSKFHDLTLYLVSQMSDSLLDEAK